MPKGRRNLVRFVPKGPPPELVPPMLAKMFEGAPLNEFVGSEEFVDGVTEFVEFAASACDPGPGESRLGDGGNGRSPGGGGGRSPGGRGGRTIVRELVSPSRVTLVPRSTRLTSVTRRSSQCSPAWIIPRGSK